MNEACTEIAYNFDHPVPLTMLGMFHHYLHEHVIPTGVNVPRVVTIASSVTPSRDTTRNSAWQFKALLDFTYPAGLHD